ncbi:MAG: helix-turn-helix transcriptional regulator [Bacteroidota bacterium]
MKKMLSFGIVNTKEEKYFQKLGAKIKQLREDRGVDQKAFAFDCEIGRTQLYMIENGKTNPRLLTLMKIANGLEISLYDLLKVS